MSTLMTAVCIVAGVVALASMVTAIILSITFEKFVRFARLELYQKGVYLKGMDAKRLSEMLIVVLCSASISGYTLLLWWYLYG